MDWQHACCKHHFHNAAVCKDENAKEEVRDSLINDHKCEKKVLSYECLHTSEDIGDEIWLVKLSKNSKQCSYVSRNGYLSTIDLN